MKNETIKVGLLISEPYPHLVHVAEFHRHFLEQAKQSLVAINKPLATDDRNFTRSFYFLDFKIKKERVILVGYPGSPLIPNYPKFTKLVMEAESNETNLF